MSDVKRIIKLLLWGGYLDLIAINSKIAIQLKKSDESRCYIENDINMILDHVFHLTAETLDGYWPHFECVQYSHCEIYLILDGKRANTEELIKSCYDELKSEWKIIHNDKESEIQEKLEEDENYEEEKTIVIKKYLDSELE